MKHINMLTQCDDNSMINTSIKQKERRCETYGKIQKKQNKKQYQ